MSAIVIKEGLIHYEVIGRGSPLVFIHGWLGSWRYWVPAMEDLSVSCRTYAFDLWGFGDSDKRGMGYNVNAYVELLEEFLDQLGVWRASFVGHTLGGVVALMFAAKNPERVERVMGVSVPLADTSINKQLSGFSGNGDELARLVARRASFPEVDMEARKTDASAIVSSMISATERDLRHILSPLESPVLLVHGTDDPLIKPPQPEWLQGYAANVRAIFLNGTQHFPMLEKQNKFNRLLRDFLDAGDDLASLELKDEWRRRLR